MRNIAKPITRWLRRQGEINAEMFGAPPFPGRSHDSQCKQCGLPIVECNALAMARVEAERYLRLHGYAGLMARRRVAELLPDHRHPGKP